MSRFFNDIWFYGVDKGKAVHQKNIEKAKHYPAHRPIPLGEEIIA